MTDSRDEQQAQGPSLDREATDSARDTRDAAETSASLPGREKDHPPTGSSAEGEPDTVGPIVTAVNPRIVPAGSRSPTPDAPPPGRLRKTVLATTAGLVVAGLLTGGVVLYSGIDTEERADSDFTPGPEWTGGQDDYDPRSPSPSESSSGKRKDPGPRGSRTGSPGDGDDGKRPPQKGGSQAPSATVRPPGGSGGGQGAPGSVRIWNHNSDQCINVPGGQGDDGTPLQIRTCSGDDAQQWNFASDGTVRALGLCMDVANGSNANGTVIQLAECSGNPAQQFRLSDGSDLVNPQADKCVAVRDGDIQSGAALQLSDCSGEDRQKWSPA